MSKVKILGLDKTYIKDLLFLSLFKDKLSFTIYSEGN